PPLSPTIFRHRQSPCATPNYTWPHAPKQHRHRTHARTHARTHKHTHIEGGPRTRNRFRVSCPACTCTRLTFHFHFYGSSLLHVTCSAVDAKNKTHTRMHAARLRS
ncbi:unnamed protein product, partial [Ectocarpus fasciculatus]